jgi:hypothetical protein
MPLEGMQCPNTQCPNHGKETKFKCGQLQKENDLLRRPKKCKICGTIIETIEVFVGGDTTVINNKHTAEAAPPAAAPTPAAVAVEANPTPATRVTTEGVKVYGHIPTPVGTPNADPAQNAGTILQNQVPPVVQAPPVVVG